MFGFMIGAASLIGLIWVLRGGGCRGYGGHFGHRGRGWGYGRFGWFDRLFDRLGITSSQERDVRAAVDEFFTAARDFKRDVVDTRADVARSVKADAFDETLMGEVFSRHDDAMDKLRKSFVGALARIHSVLDDRQRERLADLIASGMGHGWGRGGGPYRG
jgi:Spy/CpxP family protein refolding chaperone